MIDAPGRAIGPEAFAGLDLAGRAVLLRTGWDRYWRTETYGSPEHPYLTAEGAKALVADGAALVGIDSVNIDDTSEAGGGTHPARSTLLAAGIPVVENLCLLNQLPEEGFQFFAVPVKVRGMGTMPVRAFACVSSE